MIYKKYTDKMTYNLHCPVIASPPKAGVAISIILKNVFIQKNEIATPECVSIQARNDRRVGRFAIEEIASLLLRRRLAMAGMVRDCFVASLLVITKIILPSYHLPSFSL